MSIGHTSTPMPKTPKLLKDFIVVCRVPVDFHIWYPRKMNLPFPAWDIFNRQTNIRQPLKSLNNMVVSYLVHRSRDNTSSVRFQKHRPEHVIANGRYSDSVPKGFHCEQFQKQISKCKTFLSHYIEIVHAVGQELLLIAESFLFCSSYHSKNLARSSLEKVCPTQSGFRIRAQPTGYRQCVLSLQS